MKEDKNMLNLLISSDIINMVCVDIAKEKTGIEINTMLFEELSEFIKAVIKLQRWENGEITLRCDFNEIFNNLYEELADVIIMILQFIYKNDIECEKLLNEICKKLIRYYETKQE